MRQQSVVKGPQRHEPKILCNANEGPALSDERALHFRIGTFSYQENNRKCVI
jgi:hypothetical protein